MITPPTFTSEQAYRVHRADPAFWEPYVVEILKRHDLAGEGAQLAAGIGGTYPTFHHGDLVVKLFGFLRMWRGSFAAEQAAHRLIATDAAIAAPRLLAAGRLSDDSDAPWPYLISRRMSGTMWHNAGLSPDQRLAVIEDLGRQIRRVHALDPSRYVPYAGWQGQDVTAAAAHSSLPPHLIPQIDDFLARLGLVDPVFVHGDLMYRHIFVTNGRLTGIIDWGDALLTDRHYELAKLHLDLFDCDKRLLRAFLEASSWPAAKDFAQKAMGLALIRQAHGLAQHLGMDVFYKLPQLLALQEIGTLEELADELFAV